MTREDIEELIVVTKLGQEVLVSSPGRFYRKYRIRNNTLEYRSYTELLTTKKSQRHNEAIILIPSSLDWCELVVLSEMSSNMGMYAKWYENDIIYYGEVVYIEYA